MMRLKITAETLRRLGRSVARMDYVTPRGIAPNKSLKTKGR